MEDKKILEILGRAALSVGLPATFGFEAYLISGSSILAFMIFATGIPIMVRVTRNKEKFYPDEPDYYVDIVDDPNTQYKN